MKKPATGTIRFGTDIQGVFIRGEEALYAFLPAVEAGRSALPDGKVFQPLYELLTKLGDVLRSAHEAHTPFQLRSFDECLDPGPERGGPDDR